MQRMIISMMPVFAFIYEILVILCNTFKVIIGGIRNYTPIVYNFMWNFTEALHDKGYDDDDDEIISPKTTLINNSWCNIDPNNIIKDEDKKRM